MPHEKPPVGIGHPHNWSHTAAFVPRRIPRRTGSTLSWVPVCSRRSDGELNVWCFFASGTQCGINHAAQLNRVGGTATDETTPSIHHGRGPSLARVRRSVSPSVAGPSGLFRPERLWWRRFQNDPFCCCCYLPKYANDLSIMGGIQVVSCFIYRYHASHHRTIAPHRRRSSFAYSYSTVPVTGTYCTVLIQRTRERRNSCFADVD